MTTLSLAMIVRDEEKVIGRILADAKAFCDEIIVVDTGSTDATVAIVESHGARVHRFAWIDDFAAARNFSFAQCTGDWIIWLDADDRISDAAAAAIAGLKTTLLTQPEVSMVYVPYIEAWGADGQPSEVQDRERLVRRSALPTWSAPVHETLAVQHGTSVTCAAAAIEHRRHPDYAPRREGRNLRIYERSLDLATCSPHMLYQFACELHWNSRLVEAVSAFGLYLQRSAETADVVGNQYLACLKMSECARLTGQPELAMRLCLDAIRRDPTRAEAFSLAGSYLVADGAWAAAWPYLVAASCMPLPEPKGRRIFTWFYGDFPRRHLQTCLEHLGAANRRILSETVGSL